MAVQRRGRGRPATAAQTMRRRLRVKARKFRTPKYHFKRGADLISYTGSGAALYAGWTFALASVINPVEFTALFDQYRINAILVKFHYRLDPGAAVYGIGASYPRLYTVKDYDDATAPTTVSELREYSKCKLSILNPNKPLMFKIKPCVKNSVGLNSTPKWKQWLDCSINNTQHFGFKWCVDNLPSNSILEVEIVYYLSFKDAQ